MGRTVIDTEGQVSEPLGCGYDRKVRKPSSESGIKLGKGLELLPKITNKVAVFHPFDHLTGAEIISMELFSFLPGGRPRSPKLP